MGKKSKSQRQKLRLDTVSHQLGHNSGQDIEATFHFVKNVE